MPAPFYVYTLHDQEGTIFYVGKGCGPRMYAHENNARLGKSSPVCDHIRSIWRTQGWIVKNKVFITADANKAYLRESEIIRFLGIKTLCNRIPGGFGGTEGNRNAVGIRTKEQKERIRRGQRLAQLRNLKLGLNRRGVPLKEKIARTPKKRWLSAAHRKSISNALKGKSKSETHVRKVSEALRGRRQTTERRVLQSQLLKGRPWSKARRSAQLMRKDV